MTSQFIVLEKTYNHWLTLQSEPLPKFLHASWVAPGKCRVAHAFPRSYPGLEAGWNHVFPWCELAHGRPSFILGKLHGLPWSDQGREARWNHALPWFMPDHGSPRFFRGSSQMQELDETRHYHAVRYSWVDIPRCPSQTMVNLGTTLE